MQHRVKDFHDFLASNLAHCSGAGLHNFGQRSCGFSLGKLLLQFLGHVFDRHFFDLPVGCDQAEADFTAEACLNTAMQNTFVIDLDILLLDLVKAFLEHGMRWVSHETSVGLLRFLSLIKAV